MEQHLPVTILIIDDDAAYRKLATLLLEGHGNSVMAARSADEGLRIACEQAPDLVLMDMHLPGTDGFRVLRRFQEDPRARGLPVIAVTAAQVSGEQKRQEARAAGFHDFVTKPINSAGFKKLLDDWRGASSP
jgi:CheY-like chemotaxis protein